MVTGLTAAIAARHLLRGFSGRKICAQIVDEGVSIGGFYQSTPLDHFVHFFSPCGFVQPLLDDDARVVALGACGADLGLSRTRWQIRSLRSEQRNGA
jgi:hypothetical protein